MHLIVSLGNHGKKYEKTRHNVGFLAADKIAANFQFSIFNFQSIFNAKISKGEIAGKKVILVKPQTFMNLSGKAVKKLTYNLKLKTNNLLVVHDDIDLPLGKIKISVGRSSAGHKGVQSIIDELGTKNFTRFRLGIQPKTGKPENVEDFVLKKFTKEEEKIVQEVIEKTCQAIEFFLESGLEKTMSKYNV
ncbi:MAG: aminoacyl-tRNA hydrolase [Candidatus Nealsonbacteria bacterium CG08_land_8_20_14_0_20_38_20]|uniref:Peptidyl-tRNA hydrolase n=1 Tax=Candidatus Nealsonbacteria bacterium CG08_land_8_20_14_0_20_38_20 TaxID=1974705 RepID=A0A2H0YLP1_9BACT|nr:MAG: aminoacyl-tRNA hydrolase [Candidatus Nealsonbacteria bacterium CG08_land_8_20_14_0_20_38_20]